MRVFLSKAGRMAAIMVIAALAAFATAQSVPAAAHAVQHVQTAQSLATHVAPDWRRQCHHHCGCANQCRCVYSFGNCGNGYGLCGYGYTDYGPAGGIGYGYGCCYPDCCYGSYGVYGNPGYGCCNSYGNDGYGGYGYNNYDRRHAAAPIR